MALREALSETLRIENEARIADAGRRVEDEDDEDDDDEAEVMRSR